MAQELREGQSRDGQRGRRAGKAAKPTIEQLAAKNADRNLKAEDYGYKTSPCPTVSNAPPWKS